MDIVVVASDKHSKTAEDLAEYISNNKGHNAINLSLNQYKMNNNDKEKPKNLIIIGDETENSLTSIHMKDLKVSHSNNGVFYGYDKNNVVLFGRGDLRDKNALTKMIKDIGFTTSTSVIFEVLAAFVIISIIGYVVVKIFKGHMGKREGKHFKILQTQVAADSFMKNDFDSWVNLNK
ncbi:hypothetical protein [Abyssisolibacter fermentans]|uniref:hypothetical protein n=1 Tax=Abyssisolibacter fermentans TaxID=1766203 RepID=UPI00082A1B16|nr:hypothetical protein [Abyssisolibacter fermentans]